MTTRNAVISEDGLYRYQLTRRWGDEPGHVLWIMLNPSTADGAQDDATIRRCIAFSRSWGFDALEVLNLYALRCTRPIHLEHHPDPVGPENLGWFQRRAPRADLAVLAWGAHATPRQVIHDPAPIVQAFLLQAGVRMVTLGLTKEGHPRHPLYVRASTEPSPFVVAA